MNKAKLFAWLKKVGWIGFFFFLLKGIVWLFIFYYGGKEILK
jgi:hypothetical protein